MEKILVKKEEQLEELNISKEQAINAIHGFGNDLQKLIQNLEKVSIKEVEKVFSEVEIIIKQEIADVKCEILHANNCNRNLQTSVRNKEEYTQHLQTSEEKEECTRNLQTSDEKEGCTQNLQTSEENTQECTQILQTPGENKKRQYDHRNVSSDKLARPEDLIKSMETSLEAKIVFNEDNYIRDILNQIKDLGSVTTTKSRTHAYYVSNTKDLNVRLSNDTDTCNISDACLVEPNLLLLVDNCNKKLKRLHTFQMTVLDHLNLPAHPYCVCLTSKQEAVVSLSNNSLQFVSLGNNMSLTRQINLTHCCYGIACEGESMFITDSSCSLYIYDKSGKLLRVVSKDSSGKNLFHYSRQIAVNDTRKELLVTDLTQKLTILDVDGEFINTFNDISIEQANGINTDGRGSVFVCGYTSRNIIQIGPNGKKKGIIAKSSESLIDHPYSICFVPGQCLLFVTQGNSDRLKVFYLK